VGVFEKNEFLEHNIFIKNKHTNKINWASSLDRLTPREAVGLRNLMVGRSWPSYVSNNFTAYFDLKSKNLIKMGLGWI
jgi:hypothetical protein